MSTHVHYLLAWANDSRYHHRTYLLDDHVNVWEFTRLFKCGENILWFIAQYFDCFFSCFTLHILHKSNVCISAWMFIVRMFCMILTGFLAKWYTA